MIKTSKKLKNNSVCTKYIDLKTTNKTILLTVNQIVKTTNQPQEKFLNDYWKIKRVNKI